MSMTDVYIKELERAGLFNEESDYGGMLGEAVKELLLVFKNQGHSGYSAQCTSEIFRKLIKGEPLSPLTDTPDEWMEISTNKMQNLRVPNVFIDKEKDSRPYTLDGKAFSDDGGLSYWTNSDSRVYFNLPGYPPKTEYIIIK